jgi:O-antigen/teichoic acid export membrane protein
LLLLPLAVVNAVIAPIIVALWAQQRVAALQAMLSTTATVAALAAGSLYLAFVLFGRSFIAMVWSDQYDAVYLLFLILGIGQVMHNAAGSSGVMLVLLGRQFDAMRLTIVFGIGTIAAALVSVNLWTTIGVAFAFAGGNFLQTLAFARAVQRHFKLNPFANPQSLRRRRDESRAL